jgi:hypothetical protein
VVCFLDFHYGHHLEVDEVCIAVEKDDSNDLLIFGHFDGREFYFTADETIFVRLIKRGM